MIAIFEQIDRSIILFINGLHNSFLDQFMWIVSGKLTWIPLYLFIIYFSFVKLGKKNFTVFILLLLLSIGLSDFFASQIIKEYFQRYRPSHNLLLMNQLHLYEISEGNLYRGGQYGFVSSHAANFFAIASFVMLVFRSQFKWIPKLFIPIAVVVAYSRIYLGVHYFSDVFFGGLLGVLMAYLVYKFLYLRLIQKDIFKV